MQHSTLRCMGSQYKYIRNNNIRVDMCTTYIKCMGSQYRKHGTCIQHNETWGRVNPLKDWFSMSRAPHNALKLPLKDGFSKPRGKQWNSRQTQPTQRWVLDAESSTKQWNSRQTQPTERERERGGCRWMLLFSGRALAAQASGPGFDPRRRHLSFYPFAVSKVYRQ